MKYNPTSAALWECAGLLRNGRSPVEVADMLDSIAGRLDAAGKAQETADAPPPDHVVDALADLTGRLRALHDAMRECAKKEALHPSVRFVCDTIALNLAAPTGGPGNG